MTELIKHINNSCNIILINLSYKNTHVSVQTEYTYLQSQNELLNAYINLLSSVFSQHNK